VALPLAGVRVLDLSRHLPGPYVTGALSDLGASVIKVEDTGLGDPTRMVMPATPDGRDGALHAWLNRGKRGIAVDLKSDEGVAIVRALAAKSDVLVESFRPGVMKRLGLDHSRLRRVAPKLVFVSLSGYGAHGPRARRATHDLNVMGETGLVAADGSVPPGLFADTAAGLLAIVAILARLQDRRRKDFKGGSLDLSILDGGLALQASSLIRFLAAPQEEPDDLWGTHACYRTYECADGRWMAVASLEPRFWKEVCETLGLARHVKAQWSKRRQPGVCADFEAVFRTKAQKQWIEVFDPLDVCVTPVRTLGEAAEDPQVKSRAPFVPLGAGKPAFPSPAFLPQLCGTRPRKRAPRHGEHTSPVLRSLGYSKTRLRALRDTGVIQ
jgi:alpha-methylacyl-CoA racemase